MNATAAKERPIPFSGQMVRAILEGRKTQTRRIVRSPRKEFCAMNGLGHAVFTDDSIRYQEKKCPYGIVGDRLWVRESHRFDCLCDDLAPSAMGDKEIVRYEADGFQEQPFADSAGKLRPPMFMMRRFSRITLEILDVRVERLQAIDCFDALDEGWSYHVKCDPTPDDVVQWFRRVWQSINGADSWNLNPWVWVISFRRCEP